MKVPNHKLSLEWSGEFGVESSSTGFCTCGWQESASSQDECRNEYRFHLKRVIYLENQIADENVSYWHGLMELASRRRMSEEQVKKVYIDALRGNKLPVWIEKLDLYSAGKFRSQINANKVGIHKDWNNF